MSVARARIPEALTQYVQRSTTPIKSRVYGTLDVYVRVAIR